MNIQAPPSEARKIVAIPDPYKELTKVRGLPGVYTGSDDSVNPWVPWGPNAEVRYLGFDVRQNVTYVHLRISGPGVIGTHYHRGQVVLVPLVGTMRYLEYSWVAGPGDFVLERPGEAHTLVTDHPDGTTLYGQLQGAMDFYDENANFVVTADIWYWMNHYESYCREKGIPINESIYV